MSMEKPIWADYVYFWSGEDEPGYDGIHNGEIKGIMDDAPPEVKRAYEEFLKEEAEAAKKGICL